MTKKSVSEVLSQRSRRTRWSIILLLGGLLALQASVFALVIGLIWGESVAAWLPELLIGSAFLLVGGALALIVVAWQQRMLSGLIGLAASRERDALSAARNQATALKALAAAIGSARDVDGLFDITLDIYQLALNDYGVPPEDQAIAIYLLDNDHLSAAAARGLVGPGMGAHLERQQGITGQALAQAELLVSDRPDQDLALSRLAWLQASQQVICAPLCTARGLYGLVLLATKEALLLSTDEKGLLEAIADQVAMALHSFQLHHNLELTRIAYLTAEDGERRLVGQALRDGPSRDIATVAMRLGLIRTMMIKDPGQAAQELHKMESQTRQSAEVLRDLVTFLRPLDLGVQHLDQAVDATLRKIEGTSILALRVGRREADKRLGQQTIAVILYVLEGSLAWASKYGKATAAEINYWSEEDRFYLTIDDDGYGLVQGEREAIARDADLATSLMRAKVERVGGQLELTPKPGRGVSTMLVAPLDQQGRPPKR